MPTTVDYLLDLRGFVALVGNGAMGNCGSAIDRFDSVIRFNGFKTRGFEKIAGTRTTLWCTYGEIEIPWYSEWPAISPFTRDSEESQYRDNFPDLHYSPIAHEIIQRVPRPTTGGMLAALCHYLGKPVTLFGFDGLRTGHYFDPVYSAAGHPHHRAGEELDILLSLPGIALGRADDAQ